MLVHQLVEIEKREGGEDSRSADRPDRRARQPHWQAREPRCRRKDGHLGEKWSAMVVGRAEAIGNPGGQDVEKQSCSELGAARPSTSYVDPVPERGLRFFSSMADAGAETSSVERLGRCPRAPRLQGGGTAPRSPTIRTSGKHQHRDDAIRDSDCCAGAPVTSQLRHSSPQAKTRSKRSFSACRKASRRPRLLGHREPLPRNRAASHAAI